MSMTPVRIDVSLLAPEGAGVPLDAHNRPGVATLLPYGRLIEG
jgi:hypothetical protein